MTILGQTLKPFKIKCLGLFVSSASTPNTFTIVVVKLFKIWGTLLESWALAFEKRVMILTEQEQVEIVGSRFAFLQSKGHDERAICRLGGSLKKVWGCLCKIVGLVGWPNRVGVSESCVVSAHDPAHEVVNIRWRQSFYGL